MKIIDAHLHLFPAQEAWAEETAQSVGHHNSVDHLRQVYGELDIVHGVVMGNRSLELGFHRYPKELFHYCVGLDSLVMDGGRAVIPDLPDRVEEHLKRENCCGVKLYPGYNKIWLSDPIYRPIYDLAARYDKPVAVHMGLTASGRGHLKYSHPLALDEAAADHRHTRFVMCHFGNPFLEAAAAVVEKNRNVAADLSGLCLPAAHLADGHLPLGRHPVRHRLAHCQSGGVYPLCPGRRPPGALGAGVFPKRQPGLRPGAEGIEKFPPHCGGNFVSDLRKGKKLRPPDSCRPRQTDGTRCR